ncbi:endonuclease domain-containing protein [Aquipuribacter sp. SD81]|uniref:endonuclease domain-containing protein n=1 Tax=Aquipuribacter sp. SD81 TaxID=3127703 RepID=UPI0030160CCD
MVDTLGDFGAVTSEAWTAFDLARGLNRDGVSEWQSVAEVDSMLRWSPCTRAQLLALLDGMPAVDAVARARSVAELVRDDVDSPPETHLRLAVLEARLPEPLVQCTVRDAQGRVVARLDLGWPALRAGVEYDGAVHDDPEQRARDRVRHNMLRALGWRVLQVDARQMAGPRTVLLEALRRLVDGPAT